MKLKAMKAQRELRLGPPHLKNQMHPVPLTTSPFAMKRRQPLPVKKSLICSSVAGSPSMACC